MKKRILTLLLIVPLAFMVILTAHSLTQKKHPTKTIFHLAEKPMDLPFSPAILIRDTLFISGQLAVDPATRTFEGGTMAQQAERIIKNIEILLKKADMDLSDVVKTAVYIQDFEEFGEFNTVFRKMFPNDPPTRATVQVAKLAREAKIEISAIALK